MLDQISVVIICKNAANTLHHVLEATTPFSEVLIYDNGSTDETLEIAKRFDNVTTIVGEFSGFGPTKRNAVSLARHDWILALDADETPSQALIEALQQWPDQATPHQVGMVMRENFMLGRQVKHSGWGEDWLVRLFHRESTNFNEAMVHEKVDTSGSEVIRLSGTIHHRAVEDLSQFLDKVNRYSSIRAENDLKPISPALIVLKSLFAFFRTYVLRLGILDGWRGLVISVSNANGVFWKHMKAYARSQAGR
ncbi:glycosyltransferase family 2 protein [Onishia taeanensis]